MYLPDNAAGSRITGIWLDDVPLDPAGTYRVTMNSFLAAGADNFDTLSGGTDPTNTGDNDLTMLLDYLAANSPVTADTAARSSVGVPDTDPVVPTCGGLTATIVGTEGSDVLRGTGGPDVIVGLGGSDRIVGGSGNDVICGGGGSDTIDGGSGNDRLHGGSGSDILIGGSGKDSITGGPGSPDRCDGGSSTDTGGRGCEIINSLS